MSHNDTTTGGDDLGSTDEVKIFKDEGDREDEKNSSENLFEEKSSLIDLTESEFASFQKKNKSQSVKSDNSTPVFGKIEQSTPNFNMGYLMSHYGSYANGPTVAGKMGIPQFFCHNNTDASLTTPPPAHCGIPPYQLDPKIIGLAGRPFFAASPYSYPILSPDLSPSQLGPTWHTPTVYASANFKNPYTSTDFPFRFTPNMYHNNNCTDNIGISSNHRSSPSTTIKQENVTNYNNNKFNINRNAVHGETKDISKNVKEAQISKESVDKKRPHIKKPLNAFMLYMKEMRSKVVNECTLKESAAINKILGQKWHELNREEQSKYYEKARKERQLHMELYPGWSARDNYGYVSKKKKHKKDRQPTDSLANTMKKCRARFGLDQQSKWCKPCRRKKKCIFYSETQKVGNNIDGNDIRAKQIDGSDNFNFGSCSSVEDLKTPDDDGDSYNHSLSSPGGLSSFSSLQSPSTSITSHSNQITSPTTPNSCQAENIQQTHHQYLVNSVLQKELLSPNHNFNDQAPSRKSNENEVFENNSSHINKSGDSNITLSSLPNDNTISASMSEIETLKNSDSPIDDKSSVNKLLTSSSSKVQTEIQVSGPVNMQYSTANKTNEIGKKNILSSLNSLSSMSSSISSTISSIKSFSPLYEDPFCNSLTPKNEKPISSPSPIIRNPVGANPRDINNPLNIKQLTNRNDNFRNVSPVTSNCAGQSINPTGIPFINLQVNNHSTSVVPENFSTFSHLENSINSYMRQHKSYGPQTATPQSHYHQMLTEASGMPFSQHIPHIGHYFGSITTQSESVGLVNSQFSSDNFKKQSNNTVASSEHIRKSVDNSSSESTSKTGAITVT